MQKAFNFPISGLAHLLSTLPIKYVDKPSLIFRCGRLYGTESIL